jgi:hypothetical protein
MLFKQLITVKEENIIDEKNQITSSLINMQKKQHIVVFATVYAHGYDRSATSRLVCTFVHVCSSRIF